MDMSSFEKYVDEATARGPNQVIPSCVAVAFDGKGVVYEKSSGNESVDPKSPLFNKPMSPETTMWIASCTKLMVAVCVLQCVEKGMLNLDDDVSTILPELKDINILKGFSEKTGEPEYEKAKNKITLRLLMTHSSGLSHPSMHPLITQLRKFQGRWPPKPTESLHDVISVPLLYEPGTGWCYGVGLDWAGEMVARVTHQTLGSYMEKNIWEPLALKSTTFHLSQRSDIAARRLDMSMRVADGSLINSPTRLWSEKYADDHGGGGLYSCSSDYVRFLSGLLAPNSKLLKPESLDDLFRPQLSAESKAAFHWLLYESDVGTNYTGDKLGMSGEVIQEGQAKFGLTGNLPKEADVDYALGGLVNRNNVLIDVKDKNIGLRRPRNTLAWGGLPNLHWSLNREIGTGLFYASQLLPAGDRPSVEVWRRFEESVNGHVSTKL